MHCRDIRSQIRDGGANLDAEARKHILSCPRCAKVAEAARLLDGIIECSRNAESGMPFETLKERVEALQMQKKERQKKIRPRFIAASAVFAVALLALTLIPFSYTKTVGYKVVIPDAGKYCDTAVHQMTRALESIGYVDARVTYDENNRSYTLSGLPDEEGAKELAAGIVDIVQCGGQAMVEPDRKVLSGTLYAQMVDKVADKPKSNTLKLTYENGKYQLNHKDLSAIFDAKDMTREEKRKAIWKLLDELGVSESIKYVIVSTDDEVERIEFYLSVDSTNEDPPTRIKLTSKEGDVYGVVVDMTDKNGDSLTASDFEIVIPDSLGINQAIHFEIVLPDKDKK
ncbi:MAG: hypothetical protein R3F48_00710 [Candidatus Zixiibacteriota bacterium]